MYKFFWTKKQAYLAGVKDTTEAIKAKLPNVIEQSVEQAMQNSGIPQLNGTEILVKYHDPTDYYDALAKEELFDTLFKMEDDDKYIQIGKLKSLIQDIRTNLLAQYISYRNKQ